jgi:hypothetical protein
MSSNINEAIPPLGAATTAGVRANFLAAKNEITALQESRGFANYQDTATATTPISLSAGVWTNLTNNELGALTLNKLPGGIDLWNNSTNRFVFTALPLYTQLTGRFDIQITTAGNNSDVDVRALVGIGSASEYAFPLMTQHRFASSGAHQVNIFNGMYIGSNDVKNNPAAIQIRCSGTATVKVNGWYLTIQKPTFE